MNTHRVALLVVIGKGPYAELARSFVATAQRIGRFVSEQEPPFIAKVYRASRGEATRVPEAPGRVELWYPKARSGR